MKLNLYIQVLTLLAYAGTAQAEDFCTQADRWVGHCRSGYCADPIQRFSFSACAPGNHREELFQGWQQHQKFACEGLSEGDLCEERGVAVHGHPGPTFDAYCVPDGKKIKAHVPRGFVSGECVVVRRDHSE